MMHIACHDHPDRRGNDATLFDPLCDANAPGVPTVTLAHGIFTVVPGQQEDCKVMRDFSPQQGLPKHQMAHRVKSTTEIQGEGGPSSTASRESTSLAGM